jgi:hypothetical protein
VDARDRLADVLVDIGERLRCPLGLDARVALDRAAELVVGEREHPAVGVMDEDDLLGAQQPLRDGQRADFVVGDHAAGVADDVGVALLQAEQAVGVEAGVHARDHCDLATGGQRQVPLVERGGVGLGVTQELVGDGHLASLVRGMGLRGPKTTR